jgi:ABC-type dipeptide/oligopeptide/nickel transport system ATPase subunit
MPPKSLIEFENVSYAYLKQPAVLKNINLSVKPGKCLAILGASGSGKSTLGKLMAGFLKPTSGQLIFDAKFHNTKNHLELCRKKQLVFQDPSSTLTPFYSPYRTLYDVLKLHFSLNELELNTKIEEILESFNLKKTLFHQKISKLSGGEKQRLSLARSFCIEPELLILDEPLSSCDPFLQKDILRLIKDAMQKRPLTVVVIVHDLAHAGFLADDICLLKEGQIESYQETAHFLTQPSSHYARLFVEAFY